jgi:hypothetical protein
MTRCEIESGLLHLPRHIHSTGGVELANSHHMEYQRPGDRGLPRCHSECSIAARALIKGGSRKGRAGPTEAWDIPSPAATTAASGGTRGERGGVSRTRVWFAAEDTGARVGGTCCLRGLHCRPPSAHCPARGRFHGNHGHHLFPLQASHPSRLRGPRFSGPCFCSPVKVRLETVS